jgi:hypothetical protein
MIMTVLGWCRVAIRVRRFGCMTGRHRSRWAIRSSGRNMLVLELLGEIDAIGAGFTSLAHWLSWSCSMTPGLAREHVWVAQALRLTTIAIRRR